MTALDLQRVRSQPCPICEATDSRMIAETVWEAPEAGVYGCEACGVLYLYPPMGEDEEEAFYESQFPTYMKGRGAKGETGPAEHFRANRPEARRRSAYLLPLLSRDSRILELGSSTGFLLAELRPHVSEVVGVEPGESYRTFARQRGIPTFPRMSDLSDRSFDLICAYYVFEHIRDPVAFLQNVQRRLAPGGRLVLEVPNVEDALVSLYRVPAFDHFYWQKAHYFYYSRDTLAMILERAGYVAEMIPEQRYDISNHIHWLSAGEPGGQGRYAHIYSEELNREYARCLKRNWLCDTLVAVARRRGDDRAG